MNIRRFFPFVWHCYNMFLVCIVCYLFKIANWGLGTYSKAFLDIELPIFSPNLDPSTPYLMQGYFKQYEKNLNHLKQYSFSISQHLENPRCSNCWKVRCLIFLLISNKFDVAFRNCLFSFSLTTHVFVFFVVTVLVDNIFGTKQQKVEMSCLAEFLGSKLPSNWFSWVA